MKPHRIRMTHNLLVNYGLYKHMNIYRPRRVTEKEMTMFHSDDYINFLRMVTDPSANTSDYSNQKYKFNVGEDCPVFDGLYQFCQISSGGSVGGAIKLNQSECDIAVNWAGGLHHAKKSEASGFCYVNDIVLAILELLKVHSRILYIDIDIHHGDGVEEAFYTTDRVMCVSFHKFGEFFPGTGHIRDIGVTKGKYYSLNFPLRDGIDDTSYQNIFRPVIESVMDKYRPGAIVMQCGADSLSGDRLGCFNLTTKGHGACVEYVKSFNVPVLVLGGGGYTIRNVARCWAYETSVCLNKEIPDELPYNDYLEYYGPEYRLHITPTNMENLNSSEYLESCTSALLENLRHLDSAPSVQFHHAPKPLYFPEADAEMRDPDVRVSQAEKDAHVPHDAEMSDSDDEDGRRDCTIPMEERAPIDPKPLPAMQEKNSWQNNSAPSPASATVFPAPVVPSSEIEKMSSPVPVTTPSAPVPAPEVSKPTEIVDNSSVHSVVSQSVYHQPTENVESTQPETQTPLTSVPSAPKEQGPILQSVPEQPAQSAVSTVVAQIESNVPPPNIVEPEKEAVQVALQATEQPIPIPPPLPSNEAVGTQIPTLSNIEDTKAEAVPIPEPESEPEPMDIDVPLTEQPRVSATTNPPPENVATQEPVPSSTVPPS